MKSFLNILKKLLRIFNKTENPDLDTETAKKLAGGDTGKPPDDI